MIDETTAAEFQQNLPRKTIVNFSLIHFEGGQYWAKERTDPNARGEALAANRRLAIWQAAKELYAPREVVPEGWRVERIAGGGIVAQGSSGGVVVHDGDEDSIAASIFYAFLNDILTATKEPQ